MKYIAKDIMVGIWEQTWKSFGIQQWEFIVILCKGDCSLGNVLVLPGENGILINNEEHDEWERNPFKKEIIYLLSNSQKCLTMEGY